MSLTSGVRSAGSVACDATPDTEQSSDRLREAEQARLEIMDTEPEARFERIVTLARILFDAPAAAISLVDRDRQWHKSRSGMGLAEEGPRSSSFCNRAIEANRVFVVTDARQDDRFRGNPLVEGPPYIRFYAGAPLITERGVALGALCILSTEPRTDFAPEDQRRLEALAGVVTNEMELRLKMRQQQGQAQTKEQLLRQQMDEAYYRVRNRLEYGELIAEIQSGEMEVGKLAALAVAAWEQHVEADGVLANSIRSLRKRMTQEEYKGLLRAMPGFAM